MKHRSVIAFILLAAALFAAPQISNDLSALKSAISARVRGEILNAFLNLRAGDGANALVTRRAEPLLASYQAEDKACAGPRATVKKSDGRALGPSRAQAAAKSASGEQFAMLIDPKTGIEQARAALSNAEAHAARVGEAAALPQGFFARGDLAMLNSPDAGIDLPSLADALMSGSNEKDGARRWQKAAEQQVRVAYVATSFEKPGAQKAGEEMLRRIGISLTDAEAARALEKGMRVRVLNVRRANRGGNSKTSEPQPVKRNAPPPVPVAALVPPDLAQPPSPCATASE